MPTGIYEHKPFSKEHKRKIVESRRKNNEVWHSEKTKEKIGKANTKHGKIKVKCEICGKEKEVYYYRLKRTKRFICNGKCRSIWLSKQWGREKNPNWKGGKYKTVQGYILINLLNHPNANKKGYVI